MEYTFTHRVIFKDGSDTLPYRSTRWWKTAKGALKAAEKHAKGMNEYFEQVGCHSLAIYDRNGVFIMNEAA